MTTIVLKEIVNFTSRFRDHSKSVDFNVLIMINSELRMEVINDSIY